MTRIHADKTATDEHGLPQIRMDKLCADLYFSDLYLSDLSLSDLYESVFICGPFRSAFIRANPRLICASSEAQAQSKLKLSWIGRAGWLTKT